MDKNLYKSILKEIESSNFAQAVQYLQEIDNQHNTDYLYLRCYLFYTQNNFYMALDTLIICYKKFFEDFKTDSRFLNLLNKILIALERFDLLDCLKNSTEKETLLKKLALWN